MAMIRFKPLNELAELFENLDLSSFSSLPTDIYEKDGNIIIKVNIPGIKPEDVDITLEDNHIRVSGSIEETQEDKDKNYYVREIRTGSFERVIPIPFKVDANEVDAEFDNGTLTITLPHKKDVAQNKKIKARNKQGAKESGKKAETKARA